MSMKKKQTTKKTVIRLSPKDAEDIIRQEFTDSRGNNFVFRMNLKPHSPKEPTIRGTVDYKEGTEQ